MYVLIVILDCSCEEELEPQSCRSLVYIFDPPRPPSGQRFSQHTNSSFLASNDIDLPPRD